MRRTLDFNSRVGRSAAGWLLGIVVLALPLSIAGCVKANVLPTSEEGRVMALAEPRPVDDPALPLDRDETQIYRVGPKDVIRIDVRKDPTLSGEYAITDEGNILLPTVGPIHVSDLTVEEIENSMNQSLTRYIIEPDVKVGVKEYKSKVIYVVGQVASPGPQVMRADMMTLEEAIYGAGMPTSDAAMQRTHVIRPDLNNPTYFEVDLTDIIYRGRLRENVLLRPNDRVYVPSRYTTNLRAAMRELLGPIEDVQRTRSQVFISN